MQIFRFRVGDGIHLGGVEAAVKSFAPFYGVDVRYLVDGTECSMLGMLPEYGVNQSTGERAMRDNPAWPAPCPLRPSQTCPRRLLSLLADYTLRLRFSLIAFHGFHNLISCAIVNRGLCHFATVWAFLKEGINNT